VFYTLGDGGKRKLTVSPKHPCMMAQLSSAIEAEIRQDVELYDEVRDIQWIAHSR
jgi:hypothetical protein